LTSTTYNPVISITSHGDGTIYRAEEIQAIARFAREHDLYLHMDGARIANAAATLGQSLREASRDSGVDVLSFGGTKNGIMGGEAVVFFHPELAQDFLFRRKQSMQLASKMRFISAQLGALLTNDLWLTNAQHSNRMAKLLESEVRQIPGIELVYHVEANGVFAKIPHDAIARIQERYFFYVWNEEESVVRWMCSFDTTEEDVREFAKFVGEVIR
jgi:threonine aldolase